jgi:hypothetical protein
VRQEKSRESSGLIEKILHLRLTMVWLRNYPHLAGNHPCPTLLTNYWAGISLFSPSHRLWYILKAPEEQKHNLLDSNFHLIMLYFTSLTFNKLHLYPRVLPWILPSGIQRIWKSSDHRLHQCC